MKLVLYTLININCISIISTSIEIVMNGGDDPMFHAFINNHNIMQNTLVSLLIYLCPAVLLCQVRCEYMPSNRLRKRIALKCCY